MSAFFTPDEIDELARPHVIRAWFVVLDLPAGVRRLHNGAGTVFIGGYQWLGVSDPVGGRLVGLSNIEEPAFGQASAVTITLTGVDYAFLREFWDARRAVEGRQADIYWAAFDAETQQPVTGLIALYAKGQLTSPARQRSGLGRATITITIENIWASQNFTTGQRWSPAGRREAYPGDLAMDFVNVKVNEVIK